MANFWDLVNKVIIASDIILLVGDARMPEESLNREVFDKVMRAKKKLIYILNKCDLIKKEEQTYKNPWVPFIIYVSASKHFNTLALYKKIKEVSHGKEAVIGVLGYPNTGKSSIINALRGRKSAPTSSQAGFTKGVQKICLSKELLLLDSPGVIPYKESDESKHALIAAKNPHTLQDPEYAVSELLEQNPGMVEKFYKVPVSEDFEQTLEIIALKKNIFLKGRKPDTKRTAFVILTDWQKGRIRKG